MDLITIEIEQKMTELLNIKADIKNIIDSANVVDYEAYRLPDITKEQENERPEFIPVVCDKSEIALQDLKIEIMRWYAKDGLSTKAAYRLPGYIHLQLSKQEIENLESNISKMNNAKKEFKAIVLKIKNPNLRFEILHDMYRHLITINVYRQIKHFSEPKSVSFHWANKPLINKVDVSALKKKIKNSKLLSKKIDEEQWLSLVDKELGIIDSIHDTDTLRYYRETKTQPVVTVDKKQHSCPMPIIFTSLLNEKLKVSGLKEYNHGELRQGTGQKSATYTPLIERLNLYIQNKV